VPVEVFAADEQTDVAVDTLRWVRLAEAVLDAEKLSGDAELSLLFVDEASIAELNQRFLEREGPTDVLAFPIDEEPADSGRTPDSGGTGPGMASEPDEAPVLLGDIVICPAVALRNAPEHAGSYDDEMALLVVHGLLHLLGMDHDEDDEATAMEQREKELLSAHHGPLAGDPWNDRAGHDSETAGADGGPDTAAPPDTAARPDTAAPSAAGADPTAGAADSDQTSARADSHRPPAGVDPLDADGTLDLRTDPGPGEGSTPPGE
jgi:probable rRNA maturation factor